MMRILFLILLLANIVGFFLLGGSDSVTQSQYMPVPMPATKPLQLLSELTPKERQALAQSVTALSQTQVAAPPPAPVVPAAGSVSAPAAAALVCASYGPFPGDDAARTGQHRLQKAGAQVSQRLVPGKVKLGYWVYLPSFRSRKEAEAAEVLLKKRGVKDLYIVADEANRNAISLGVYSQRSGAVERRKQIRKMGYHPLLADRFRDTPNYWLDAQGSAAQLPAVSVFSDLAEGDTEVKRSDTACPANDKP
ncbi:MAG: SPOR domain-containing protein [Gammaproteobacteria bacterium]